jgi:glycerophosphoryl diester phosphodiesterase
VDRSSLTESQLRSLKDATFRALWLALPNLIAYDVAIRGISFVLFTPGLVWLFHWSIAARGEVAVGNFDIATFLVSPLGAAMSLFCGAIALALWLARMVGITYLGYGGLQGLRLSYLEAMRLVFIDRFRFLVWLTLVAMVVLISALLPLLVLAIGTYSWLLTAHDINYYLHDQPWQWTMVQWIGGVLVVMAIATTLWFLTGWALVLPESLNKWSAPRQILARSRSLSKGQSRQILLIIALCIGGAMLASLLVNSLLFYVGRYGVAWAGERVPILLAMLGILLSTSIVFGQAISFVSTSVLAISLADLHRHVCRERGEQLPTVLCDHAHHERQLRISLSRAAPLLFIAFSAIVTGIMANEIMGDDSPLDDVLISAHRGASRAAPENSLSAVREAIALGADFVEIDVQRTADGVIVVNHDADLMRVAGDWHVISKSNYAELQQIDIGAKFGKDFMGERIPTLEEVIEVARDQVNLIVELKSYRGDAAALVADVVRILRQHSLEDDAVIMSLKYRELQMVRQAAPEFRVGFVASTSLGDLTQLDIDFLAVSRQQATNVLVAAAHARDKQVFVWTVDTENDVETMLERGVDNIITNEPGMAVRVRDEREELGNIEQILLRYRHVYFPK